MPVTLSGPAPKHIPCGLVGGRDCVVCAVIPNCGDLLRYGCIRMGRASCNPLRANGALYRDWCWLLVSSSLNRPLRSEKPHRVTVVLAGVAFARSVVVPLSRLATSSNEWRCPQRGAADGCRLWHCLMQSQLRAKSTRSRHCTVAAHP